MLSSITLRLAGQNKDYSASYSFAVKFLFSTLVTVGCNQANPKHIKFVSPPL